MRKEIYLTIITLGLWSCMNNSARNLENNVITPLQTGLENFRTSNIVIKDWSQYDTAFIKGLADYKEPLQLIGKTIIAGTDTTYFPENIPLNQTVAFKASKDQKKYLLSVTRTSLTNLTYSFKLSDEKDKLLDSKSGNAILGSLFFLGSETDKDTQTGENYGSYEYWDKSNDCWFSLRIGYEKDGQGKQRAIIKYGCEDKNQQALTLEECPTLRAE